MSGGDDPKREILRAGDTLQDLDADPTARAEAEARAARRALDEQERQRREDEKKRKAEADRKLGWLARTWRRIRAMGAPIGDFFAKRMPRTAARVGNVLLSIERGFLTYVWPLILTIATKTDRTGVRHLTLTGRLMIAALVLTLAWPFFKIYYVLGTTREFHGVHITFKQIISHERYVVFGDYADPDGTKENMAFNVTDSWVYWNWTPDLTFAQIPVVGKCNFRTYGWYVRVPRFVPFVGRTLLVEPVIIDAKCEAGDLPAAGG